MTFFGKTLDRSLNNCDLSTQWDFCPFGQHLTTSFQTWINWGTALKPINLLMATGAIAKTGTLATNFHKPSEEANIYARFGYGPLEIFNHTRGKVSGSMKIIQWIWCTQVKNHQKRDWTKDLENIFNQANEKPKEDEFMNKWSK